ncbi:putative transcription factor MYB1R1 [Iris pallida]|uniref:Transcription factor MYB1R1 n=1 Tax=Iris pallida TaxID=29817 RepID=A0AAX6EBY2_IRIPA|nr:putative transcription factor MYB1R1 [Iris pallida]
MTRRCSHCSHNGHNSRTCPNRGVRLFGVRLTDGSSSIRKSASMGNLTHYSAAGGGGGGGGVSPANDGHDGPGDVADGYASEDFVQGSSSGCRERKRGVPWTEEEHRMFLLGLQKLGKGDWRGIARDFVISRTPTQVASHAQKYFIRQTNVNRRKRRSSLFDIIPDESVDPQLFPMNGEEPEVQCNNPLPVPPTLEEECESMDSNNSVDIDSSAPKPEAPQCSYPPLMYPAYFAPVFSYSMPFWPGYSTEPAERHTHEVVKPTPVHSKAPIDVDELLGMSKLSIGEPIIDTPALPSSLSQNLIGGSNRQSAFHTNPPPSGSSMKSSTGPIQAVQ